jgi:glycosyltransferase involved in cell wall biosynthesis
MQAVDVVMLTKNSEHLLDKCLASLYQNVPVNNLILVDGFSTDRTLKIAESVNRKYGNVKVISVKGTRAMAREEGIAQVATKWFMFADSDVILSKDWYKKAQHYINKNVGAVWGTEIWSTIKTISTLKLFLIVTRKVFEVRGGTHDTLIRTDLVRDIKIPKKLHVFEDAYIKEWVEGKGFCVVACYVPFCIHYRPEDVWTFRGSLGLIAEAFKFGHPLVIIKLLAAYGFYTGYSVYQFALTDKR